MEFIRLTSDLAEEWDRLVQSSADGWLFSLSFWQQNILAIPEWGYQDYSFAVRESNRLVGVCPLQLRVDGVLISSVMGTSGPVLAADLPQTFRQKVLKTIFDHVNGIATEVGARRIEIAIPPLCQSSLQNTWGVNPLVFSGFTDVSTHTRIINLLKSKEELLADLAYDARRAVKLAEKQGYTVTRENWREMADPYYRIHTETYTRTGVSPHPQAYFNWIANEVAPRQHAVLWVGRSTSGEPIAFHNCARYGKTSLYWTGCSQEKHLDSGINYLLFWHAILGAKEAGCEWYEAGESFPNSSNEKLRGLTAFKAKFGGELHRAFKGEIKLRKSETNLKAPFGARRRSWLHSIQIIVEPIFGSRLVNLITRIARFLRRSSMCLVSTIVVISFDGFLFA